MSEYHDELMGHVSWGENRSVLVFRRVYADRVFIRMRVFNRHRQKGVDYPTQRSFQVSQECAFELGQIISRAAQGRVSNPPPAWWAEFEAQYERKGTDAKAKWKRAAKSPDSRQPEQAPG